MINRRAFLASLAALAVAPRPLLAAEPRRLRVLSYNIHHARGTDGRLDLDRIAGVIRKAEPDLVALQEVDRSTLRSGNVDQAAKLGELTKLHAVFGQAMPFAGGGYGNAILSRFEIAAVATHPLPSGAKEEPRCLLLAEVRLPGGEKVRFGSTHLNHRNADERLRQAERILELAPRDGKLPTLIAGDLNATPDKPEIRALTAAYENATAGGEIARDRADIAMPAGALATFPAGRPTVQIDYVLAAPPAAWKVVGARVLDEPVASDHRPILADLELAGG